MPVEQPKRYRPCQFGVQVWIENEVPELSSYKWVEAKGRWHGWGIDTEAKNETELITITIGIVEDENGQVYTPRPEDIKFLDR